jgi:Domain of unknown function (DUF4124)
MATRILWMAVLLAMSAAASADVYRWVDAQGRVYYSDRPVENAELVSIASRPTNPEAVAARTQAESTQRAPVASTDAQRRADQAAANAVQQDVEKARDEQCKEAQAAYKTAIEKQRLYRLGKDGERQYLTDAEITETRVNTKKAVDQLCKPAG